MKITNLKIEYVTIAQCPPCEWKKIIEAMENLGFCISEPKRVRTMGTISDKEIQSKIELNFELQPGIKK